MIKDKTILYDFITNELKWVMVASEGDSDRHRSNVHYHLDRTLAYLEELINVLADQYGEEMDNVTLS